MREGDTPVVIHSDNTAAAFHQRDVKHRCMQIRKCSTLALGMMKNCKQLAVLLVEGWQQLATFPVP